MIHIDELFRQRMEDREASPKPGAWGNMRELLDKQMPVAQAATNWRRVFGYFTGVLLFASASVGGYSLYSDQLESDNGTASSALRASNTSIADGINAASPTTATAGSSVAMGGGISAPAPTVANVGNTPARREAQGRNMTNAPAGAVAAAAPGRSTQHRSGSDSRYSTTSANQEPSAAQASSRQNASGHAEHVQRADQDNIIASASQQPVFSASAAASSASPRITRTSSNPSVFNASNSGLTEATRPATAAVPLPASTAATTPSKTPDVPVPLDVTQSAAHAVNRPVPAIRVLDTIRRIEIVSRRTFMAGTRRPVYRLDTLPAEYAIVERILPVADPAPVATSRRQPAPAKTASSRSKLPVSAAAPIAAASVRTPNAAIAPSSAAPSEATDAVNTANEVAAKLSGSKLGFWRSLRLDEKVEAAKASLQSIQLYPGIIAGINGTMFTPNSLGGFQLGLTSLIALNDNWSILGELKYIHRFNTGSTLRDDYLKVDEATKRVIEDNGNTFNEYTWKESRVDHYFNYETIQTIELPVAIRYNSNRFFAQTGLNFVSSRPISAREVTNIPASSTSRRELLPEASTINPTPQNSKPNVQMADFGSRLGVGYVFGAGYMFTPSVYLDVRMAQSFWNNASTDGAKQISRDLLGKPSFQLSVGYRFGTAKQER